MEIEYRKGDVTKAEEMIIAHGCNALGVMGSGVALAIRKKFPLAYSVYVEAHKADPLQVGDVIYAQCGNKFIANMITQADVSYTGKRVVDYEGIYRALEDLNEYAADVGEHAIAFPRFGAGLGGGNWNIIAVMLQETSTNYKPIVYDL